MEKIKFYIEDCLLMPKNQPFTRLVQECGHDRFFWTQFAERATIELIRRRLQALYNPNLLKAQFLVLY